MDFERELVHITIMHEQQKVINNQGKMLDLDVLFLGALAIFLCSGAFMINLMDGRIWVCVLEAILIVINVVCMVGTVFRMIRKHKMAKEENERYVVLTNSLKRLLEGSENNECRENK